MKFADCVAAVSTAVDQLGRVDVDDATATELRALLRELKTSESKLAAEIGRVTHSADSSGAFIGTGARDTAEWLGKETGTSTRRNRNASELGQAMARSETLADAVRSGRISADKASMAVGAAGDEVVDPDLLDEVAGLPLNAVKPAVEAWRARNHPDRDADVAATQRSRRYLRLTSEADGMTRLEGLLDPESGAIVRSTLDGIMHQTVDDGTTRTRDQRCHDALAQLAHAASKGQISGGRSNTKLLVTVPFDTIVERAAQRGVAHVGNTVDATTARKLACDAGIHRVITGPASSILDFGHETRLVSDNLFLALVARDRRCRWPGCTIRATWCDAHHIVEWAEPGPTSERNCVLLCHRHHQLSHQPGWSVSGSGAELRVHHPDGTVEVSRPPGVTPPRAGTAGREPPTDHDPDAAGWAAGAVGHPTLEPVLSPARSAQAGGRGHEGVLVEQLRF